MPVLIRLKKMKHKSVFVRGVNRGFTFRQREAIFFSAGAANLRNTCVALSVTQWFKCKLDTHMLNLNNDSRVSSVRGLE